MFYDPMIAKLSVWGRNRDEAVARMRVALDELSIEAPKNSRGQAKGSLKTNVVFLQRLSRCPDVISGNTTTDLIPRNPQLTEKLPSADLSKDEAIALALLRLTESLDSSASDSNSAGSGRTVAGASVRTLWNERSRLEALR